MSGRSLQRPFLGAGARVPCVDLRRRHDTESEPFSCIQSQTSISSTRYSRRLSILCTRIEGKVQVSPSLSSLRVKPGCPELPLLRSKHFLPTNARFIVCPSMQLSFRWVGYHVEILINLNEVFLYRLFYTPADSVQKDFERSICGRTPIAQYHLIR